MEKEENRDKVWVVEKHKEKSEEDKTYLSFSSRQAAHTLLGN